MIGRLRRSLYVGSKTEYLFLEAIVSIRKVKSKAYITRRTGKGKLMLKLLWSFRPHGLELIYISIFLRLSTSFNLFLKPNVVVLVRL